MSNGFGSESDVPIPHQRAWDLLRQMRGHLSKENLISMREYAWLVSEAPGVSGSGSPAPRRLEAYDEMRARLDRVDELEVRIAALEQFAQHAYDLSTWAASINFDPDSTNTAEWLDELKERIEAVQGSPVVANVSRRGVMESARFA